VLNSIDGLNAQRFTASHRASFLDDVCTNSGLHHDAAAVTEVRTMLRQMYNQSTGNDPPEELVADQESDRFRPVEDRFDADSPVFVGQIDSSSSFLEHNAYDQNGQEEVVSLHLNQGPPDQHHDSTTSARKTSKTASRTRPGGNN